MKAEAVEVHAIMNRNGFDYDKKWRSIVWASRDNHCESCNAESGERCLNKADLKKVAREHAKYTLWPHEERVNWERLKTILSERGYR